MIVGVTFISCSLFYSIMLAFVYYNKQRINSTENKIYSILVRMNVFGLMLELACSYFVLMNGTNAFNNLMCDICNRLFIIYLLLWEFVFALYIFFVSFGQDSKARSFLKKHSRDFKIVGFLLSIILIIFALTLPLSYFNDGSYVYSYGPATNLLLVVGGILITLEIFSVFKNTNNIRERKYIPLLVLIIAMVLVFIIRSINPGIILINSTFAFVTVLMYFTIENPDVQMMEELYKNKKLIEKSNEDTSNFLFRMTQDIKRPVKDIIDVSNDMFTIKDLKELNEGTRIINNKAKELDYLINDALDVSSMSTKTLKVYDSRYNVSNLFKEIKFQSENNLNENVKFEYSISNNIPEYLYGDSIKLKQAVYSVIENAIKNTSEGYISLDISSIIKYDICRLIITVTDSGKGISIEEVNNILSLNIDDLSKINLSSDKTSLSLREIKKLFTLMGGNLIVRSDEGKGTTVSITIDQKIVENKSKEISKKLDLYEETLHKDKKVMVVDDDAKELSKITNYLEKYDISVSGSLFGRDVIEKISNKHKLNLIILDDETDTISAYEVLKELKKDKKFNVPVVIMLDDDKEFIKLHYLKDGFADVIIKSKLNDELDRIMKRF
ncbi:MAG: response regulator [Bacilli bacterium]|nr:response regulator [Bacilli bacterium]